MQRRSGPGFFESLPTRLTTEPSGVLLPLSLLAVYGLGSRLGGRPLGYASAAAWVLVPYAVHPLFVSSYHPTYVQQLLPEGFGLTGAADLPSMLCVLVAAYFAVASI